MEIVTLKKIGLQRLRGVGNDWRPWDKPVGKFGSYSPMRLTFEIKMVQTIYFQYKLQELQACATDLRCETQEKGVKLMH